MLQQRSTAAPRLIGLNKNPSVPVNVTTWQVCRGVNLQSGPACSFASCI